MVFFLDVNDKKKSQKILDWMLVRRRCSTIISIHGHSYQWPLLVFLIE